MIENAFLIGGKMLDDSCLHPDGNLHMQVEMDTFPDKRIESVVVVGSCLHRDGKYDTMDLTRKGDVVKLIFVATGPDKIEFRGALVGRVAMKVAE